MRNPFTFMADWDLHRVPHKPSPSSGGTQQTINKTELPGWVQDAGQKNLGTAYDVSQNMMQPYGGQRVADMVPGQLAAIGGLNQLPGSTTPAFNLAQQQAANVGNFQAGSVTPTMLNGMDLSGYMNPFTNSVIGTGLAGLDVQRQQALRGIGDQALASRAFGGSRQGVNEGITNTGALTSAGNLASQLAYQNFMQAQQAATGDISRDLSAQQFNEQARQQGAQLQLGGANALGGLAAGSQQAQIQALMAMLQGNGLIQGNNQAQLDAQRQYYGEQQQFPVQQLQLPLQALGMTPYGQTQTQTSPTPPSNSTMSALGGISSGLGILGALFAAPTGGMSLAASLPSLGGLLGEETMPTQQEVYDFYLSQGVAPHQAAALVGHMWAESGGNPMATHDKGTGFGLFGFRDPKPGQGRWTDLKKFAESGTGTKLDINDWKTQALFSLRELDTTEKKAGQQFYGAKDYGGAIDALTGYLRPQGYDPKNPAATHNYTGRYNFGAQLAGVSPLLGGAIAEAGGGGTPGDKITPTAPAPSTGLLANAQQNKGFDYAGLLSSGMKQMAQADPASQGGGGPPPMPNLPAHRPAAAAGFQSPFGQQQPIQTQLPQLGAGLLAPNPNNDLQLRKLLSGLLSGA